MARGHGVVPGGPGVVLRRGGAGRGFGLGSAGFVWLCSLCALVPKVCWVVHSEQRTYQLEPMLAASARSTPACRGVGKVSPRPPRARPRSGCRKPEPERAGHGMTGTCPPGGHRLCCAAYQGKRCRFSGVQAEQELQSEFAGPRLVARTVDSCSRARRGTWHARRATEPAKLSATDAVACEAYVAAYDSRVPVVSVRQSSVG